MEFFGTKKVPDYTLMNKRGKRFILLIPPVGLIPRRRSGGQNLPPRKRDLCVSMGIRVNLDPSLTLRMTRHTQFVILRTEGTKNPGFEFLKAKNHPVLRVMQRSPCKGG